MTWLEAQEQFYLRGGNTDLVAKLMEEDEELWGMPHQNWEDEIPDDDRKFLGI